MGDLGEGQKAVGRREAQRCLHRVCLYLEDSRRSAKSR